MPNKFCPLGFFSFYVNKSQAQGGACHHCVEENCALWNEEYEECSLKVGLDAVASLAENFGGGQIRMPSPPRVEVEAPKLSIFDKLRRKNEGQKLPTVDAPTATPTTSSTLQTTPVEQIAVAQIQAAPPPPPPAPQTNISNPPSNTAEIKESNNSLLKPPDVPAELLPIISVSISES